MLRRLVSLGIVFMLATNCLGQVHVQVNDQKIPLKQASLLYRLEDSVCYSSPYLENLLGKEWKPFDNRITISNIPSILWLKLPLENASRHGNFDLLYLDNAHINELRGWIRKPNGALDSFTLTGDHHAFHTRGQPATGFLFRINSSANRNDTLILVLEKRLTKLDVPLKFLRNSEAAHYISMNYTAAGVILGVILLLIFFNTLLFISSREMVYLWYTLYLICAIIYFSSNEGLLFQFVYPDVPQINDLIRPFSYGFASAPMFLFFNELLNISKHFPRIFRFNIYAVMLYVITGIIGLYSTINGGHKEQGMWLLINQILGTLMLAFMLIESVYCSVKKLRFSVFSLISFSTCLLFISLFTLGQRGIIPENVIVSNALYIALIGEIIVVACSLVWRFYIFRKEAAELQLELNGQQKKIFEETSAWQKHEMQRVSSFLHDNIGATLGFLRLKVDNMPLTEDSRKEIGQLLTEMGTEVRHTSHQFSPLQLQAKGLQTAVEDMIEGIRINSGIDIQFEWIGKEKNLDLQYEIIIYRVLQELFQNLIKHSNASEAILQIMYDHETLGIYMEDNGVGTDIIKGKGKGIGLKNIEQLISLLKGRYSVISSPGEGFSLSIEFPVIH